MKHFNIIVRGKVQRIGFRFYAMEAAYKYGVKGFIMNREDGSVYIEAEGDPDALEQFSGWCHRGPLGARVGSVEITESNVQGFTSFEIKSRAKWMNTGD